MSRRLIVVRPEPGSSATCARIAATGHVAVALPLFVVRPLDWTPPWATDHDALLLTSANAVRLGGDGLVALRTLPTYAVGEATAAAARGAGLRVIAAGAHGASELADQVATHGVRRGLLLCGRDHVLARGGPVTRVIPVYASDPVAIDRAALLTAEEAVVLLHSPRAAARFADLIDAQQVPRATIRLAALSSAVVAAAGPGWATVATAPTPTDTALLEIAVRLAD